MNFFLLCNIAIIMAPSLGLSVKYSLWSTLLAYTILNPSMFTFTGLNPNGNGCPSNTAYIVHSAILFVALVLIMQLPRDPV